MEQVETTLMKQSVLMVDVVETLMRVEENPHKVDKVDEI